ncbi:MAG: hypothetical protein EHM58_15625 [Ignavibacteriae bacterium]|nr:MAG: hypothetical protein EHM58_15625 [Ignavibacteriota bacterium]
MIKKYSITILIAVFIITYLQGCGIFDTRSPEDPNMVRSNYEPPTTPDAVLRNLEYSIQDKNSNNYGKNLSSINYSYVPDAKAQQIYGQIFLSWNQTAERHYYENLISQTNATSTSKLFLSNKTTNLITPDSAVTAADYILVFQHKKTNIPTSATGKMRLTFKSDENAFFYINQWEDFRKNDSDFTWSEMKASFSN